MLVVRRRRKRFREEQKESFGGRISRTRFAPQTRVRRRRNFAVARSLGIEKKYYDTFLAVGTLQNATDCQSMEHNPSASICLNSVVQGDDDQERDGRKMVMKFLTVKGVIYSATESDVVNMLPNAVAFVAIVLDTQTNGALLDSENVFQNPAGVILTVSSLLRDLATTGRYKVLGQKQLTLPQPQQVWDGSLNKVKVQSVQMPFSFNIPLNDIPVSFTGQTEDIANIADNSLTLLANAGNSGAGTWHIAYNSRLRFVG